MLFKAAAFAASATAFLLVPEMMQPKQDDEGVFKILPIPAQNDAASLLILTDDASQHISVPCHGCKGRKSHIDIDFSIDENGKKLLANTYELYPNASPWEGDFKASVTTKSGKETEEMLGYALSVETIAGATEEAAQLVEIYLQVFQVGDKFINDIPAVKIHLLQDEYGPFSINSVEMEEIAEPECTTMWCRAKEMFDNAFGGFKGCGRKQEEASGYVEDTYPEDFEVYEIIDFDPQDEDWYQVAEPQETDRSWGELLIDIGLNDLVPAFIGIFTGMAVALVALFVCSLAVRVVRVFIAGCKASACARHKAAAKDAADEEEKAGLVEPESSDPPPQYQDAETKN